VRDAFRVRAARPDDLPRLGAVERSAAGLFRAVGLGWIADSPTLPIKTLERYRAAGTLWVGADAEDRPAGFLAASALDSALYIDELSVAAEHQRRGIGGALLQRTIGHAQTAGYPAVMLNTYRDVPWNAPFYARRGFVEIAGEVAPLALRERLARDALHGHDPARRCGMILRLPPA
jgi:GNAT superfamily N-acetyltransferase